MTNAAPDIDYKGELVELNAIEQALAGLREQYGTVPNVQTKDGYELCKKGIKELTGYRTKTEERRKATTKKHRDFIEQVNGYGKYLVASLKEIEQPLKDAKKSEDERAEREKQERIAKLRERINVEIWSFLDTAVGLDSNGLADLHDAAVAIDVDGYFDVTAEAEDAKVEVLKRISEQHGQTLERERLAAEQAQVEADRKRLREEEEKRAADQRELEELRREKAEREAAEKRKAQPEPEPEPEPEPMPVAAESKNPAYHGVDYASGPDKTVSQTFDTSRLNTAANNFQRTSEVKASEQVTISRSEYDQLLADQAKLRALEAMGVDSWSGYSAAMDQLAA
ncbi:hypothetical protein [Halomonas sp. N3-2A]|uniref:hypothetical protein n=1 Tax=Halomonas sp. N3-2A TaxID=2014541 RepID=UPI000B5B1D33|nr:hypothetical protein [Halomonas sp. N3-2A]ASK18891.1 hypothetical protein CEK60_06055 [Halomonas sp. N3-2A]